ncbi:uncharacterized protein KIAA1958-like [Argopecten irradians]|uniref:uncharacterized protein KIAA1958-like n=1 Tax=Argopecten irradians TaxID=31199 RepID=UPI003710CD1E
MAEGSTRFAEATEDEIQKILNDRDSKNTKNVIRTAENLLHEYCEAVGCTVGSSLTNVTVDELCEILRKFYCAARKKDGSMYAKKSMISIRYGLQKSFEKSHGIDIINDVGFKTANDVFHASMVKIKKEGAGEVKHKEIINVADMKVLYDSGVFSTETPKTLQQKVFFELMLYFCNRGRENLRNMTRNDYTVQSDADGRRYVTCSVSRLTKNHRGDTADDDQDGGRMYEQPGNPNCPVASFEKYSVKLNPLCDALWQRPRQSIKEENHVWYDNMVLGKNKLGYMMQSISSEAGLGTTCSNHCIRATCISMLDEYGYESRHIIGISKHKSETSLKHYSSKLSNTKKREMSYALARKVVPQPSSSAQPPMKEIAPVNVVIPNSHTPHETTCCDMLDIDDKELAALLENPDVLGSIENIPQQSHAKSVFSFHGCNINIYNS